MFRQFLVFNICFFVGLLIISWFIKLTLTVMLVYAIITGMVFGLKYPFGYNVNKPK